MSDKQPATTEITRVGKFGAVGIVNTLIDFSLYNVLSGVVGISLIRANIISTTIAMSFSFIVNRSLVFKGRRKSAPKQALLFLGITAFGMYAIQTGAIKFLTEIWLTPVMTLVAIAHSINIVNHDQFIIKNGAKAAATVLSLMWNYIMYKKVVFS